MKKACTIFLLLVFVLSLAGCGGLSIPTEDGGKLSFSKDGLQVEGSDGSKATISDDKDGGFVMETSQGKLQVGENLDLPKGYPKDLVPLFKEDSIITSSSSETGEFSVMYISKASTDDCFKYYKELFKDAEDKMEATDENGGTVIATVKNKAIAIFISKDSEEEKKASIAITIGAAE